MKILLVLLLSSLATSQSRPAEAPAKAAPTGYHLQKTLELGGEGGWDYLVVEPESARLFVSRSTHVMVVDLASGKVAGDIPDTSGVHGIALAPELGRGFTSNGKANTATIFDLKTLAPLGTVKTGENPDAILYDPATKRVFTFNGRSANATAFDAAKGDVLGTIELGGKPEFAVADGAGKVFVNIEDKSEVVELDSKELKVLARWPIAPAEEPSGLAIDVRQKRLFSVGGNGKMAVIDIESGKVLATPAIGKGVDAAAFDPASGCAFASNGDGTLTVVHEDDAKTFTVLENAATGRGARTMALDTKTHLVYLPTAKFEDAPEPKAGERRARPKMVAGSFQILVLGK
jgi:DNA-binding beta-propeller fold protein YncE